ncbi:MAG TPA: SEC-C metal-binding domain-containing protein [Ktedonobacteraceae bacterium]|nr:SEC-C metal-binding domain-containing protein [Ktedonobacteraceae bacterium]
MYWQNHIPKTKPWYERDGGKRLAQDQQCVAEVYPDLIYHIDTQTGCVSVEGKITLLAACGIPTSISVHLEFPDDYPLQEPHVYDAKHRFPHTANRHFYINGRCCLWLPPESRWDRRDPDGLCRFLEEVAVFFDRQLVYDAEGKGVWPGPERSHDDEGYIEFILSLLGDDRQVFTLLVPVLADWSKPERNNPCPCRSGRKYKKCHLDIINTIRGKVGPTKLVSVLRSFADKQHP